MSLIDDFNTGVLIEQPGNESGAKRVWNITDAGLDTSTNNAHLHRLCMLVHLVFTQNQRLN